MTAALTPPDTTQCQAEVGGAFTMGGGRARCKSEPTVIAIEVEPGEDGQRGSMSLCDDCKAGMIDQCGKDFAVFVEIEK